MTAGGFGGGLDQARVQELQAGGRADERRRSGEQFEFLALGGEGGTVLVEEGLLGLGRGGVALGGPGRGDRRRQAHAQVEPVQQDLQDRGDDGRAAGGPYGEERLT